MSFAPALPASPAHAALRAWICLALATCLLSPSAFAAKPKKNKTAVSKNAVAAKSYRNDLRVREAARQIAERQGLSAAWVRATLAQAQKLPEVIRAASPVADPGVRNWDAYRRRVLDPVRIQAGVRFWQANATTLARAQQQSGVDAGTIVGIVGAETLYGQRMGKYRVLDALATLAFDFPAHHPKVAGRSAYFLQELEAFLLWSHQTGRDPLTVRGSYAGAMGIAQFMPSSWQKYAVDFDGDGRIDLFGSNADAIGSIANYLAAFGWKSGMPTHFSVELDMARADLPALLEKDIVPSMTPAQMQARGALLPAAALAHPGLLALVELPQGLGANPSYVVGTDNFYTVTRYNWSSFYALSVIELGQAVQANLPAPKTPD